MYPDPLRFNPDHFIKGGVLDPSVRDPDAAFGFGRRMCPGRYMACEAIWLTIACTLAVFDICKAKDEQGNAITPGEDYSAGFLQ
jgi:cytochrome P450